MKSVTSETAKNLVESLPTRERGLKYTLFVHLPRIGKVAPYTGAWIEISAQLLRPCYQLVAPYTGAWIEIYPRLPMFTSSFGRSLHGSVD